MTRGVCAFKKLIVAAVALVALLAMAGGNHAWSQIEPSPTLPPPFVGDGVLYGTVYQKDADTTATPPIARANVIVFLDVESFAPMPPLAAVKTNENGQYRFETLPTGPDFPLRVVVEKMGFERVVQFGIVIPEGDELSLDFYLSGKDVEPTPSITPPPTLTPPPTPTTGTLVLITGKVHRASASGTMGQPLAGAHVEVRAGEAEILIVPPPPPVAEATTNEQGFYQLAVPSTLLLPSRIIASKDGYKPQVKKIERLPSTGLIINFFLQPLVEPTPTGTATPPPTTTKTPEPTRTPPPMTGVVEGVVYDVSPVTTNDATTSPAGVPLPGAVVHIYPPFSAQESATFFPLGHAVTDESGQYRIDGLPAGVILVGRATKMGYTVDEQKIEPLGDAALQVDFHIRLREVPPTPSPTATEPPPGDTGLCGLVVEQSMLTVILPIPGAVVAVYRGAGSGGGQNTDPTVAPAPEPVAKAVTDESGHFCLSLPDGGWYFVQTKAEGYLPEFRRIYVPQGRTPEITIALRPIPVPSVTPTPSPEDGTVFGTVTTAVPADSLMPTRVLPGAEVLAFFLPPPPVDDLALAGNEAPAQPPAGRAVTNAEGAYVIPGLPAGDYAILCRKEGFIPQKQEAAVAAGERTEVNFALEAKPEPTATATPTPIPDAGGIHGIVFNAAAESALPAPIEGADVVVFAAEAAAAGVEGRPLPVLGRAVTNDRGFYQIRNLPPVAVVARAFHRGFQPGEVKADVQPSTSTLVNIGLNPVAVTPTPTVVPPPTDARLYGHVAAFGTDGRPHPIQGAKVCLFNPADIADATNAPEPVACAETDEQGHFYLVADPGDYAAVAAALGFEREVKQVSLVAGPNEPLKFVLKPVVDPTPPPSPTTGRVEGIVAEWQDPAIDRTSASIPIPIADALVTLYKADRNTGDGRMDDPVARTRSDAAGQFAFEDIPVGLYIGVAEKRGFERDVQSLGVKADETTNVAFGLKPATPDPTPTPAPDPGALAGIVLAAGNDTVSTHPIEGALVTAIRVNRADVADAAARPAGVAVTDADGLWQIGDLRPGEYIVVAKARGFASGRAPATIVPGETISVRIVLVAEPEPDPTAPGSIVGKVLTPSPRAAGHQGPPLGEHLALDPVEGSTVTTYLIVLDQTDPALLTPSGQAITDAEGNFAIDSLTPGLHLVVARAAGLLPAVQVARVAPDETTRVQLVLRPAGDGATDPLPPIEIVNPDDAVDTDTAHWEVQTSGNFRPPLNDRRNGWLVLRGNGNADCFGYWQSVHGWIPRRPDSLYAVSFTVAGDQLDPAESPSLRLRVNSDSLRQSDVFRVTSLGDAGLAPTVDGTSYRMYFEPMDPGQIDPESRDGLNIAFDLLNFDRNDAPNGELALTSLAIDAIPLENVGAGTVLKEWTFETDASGWTFGSAPGIFDAPEADSSNGALALRAPKQGNAFGFWSSSPDDFAAPYNGALLRARFHVTSNQTDPSQVTQFRLRLNSADGQVAVKKVVPSQGDGANSPTSAGKDYVVYFEVPPALVGQGLIASLDLLGFDPQDAADNVLTLDQVVIEDVPAPVVE